MSGLEQTIPDGYQQTEVGMIPDDWASLTLDDVCCFVGGAQPEKSTFSYKQQPGYIRLIQIRDYKSDKNTVYIPEKLARKKCDENDIMIGRYGPPIFQILRGIEGAYNVALIKAIPASCINREFLYYILKDEQLFELMDTLSQRSSGQTGVDLPALKAYPIGLPSEKEQTAIANALSDVDALLSELDKLIAKKQEIKTATMQQLLTGKARLPQFSTHTDGERRGQTKGIKPSELGEIPEDWGVLSIGEFSIKVGSGKTPKGGSSVYVDSGRPFVRSQNIGWGQLRLSDLSYITEEIHQTFSGSEIKTDDVLLNITGASIGRCALANQQIEKGNVNQHVCIIRLNSKKVKPYILQALVNSELGQNQIDSYQAGGNREGLNFSQVKNLKFPFSSIPKEQIAIAAILSDMDEEIQALKQRLFKTRQIKQGMMQELLTGKTRLIQGEADD